MAENLNKIPKKGILKNSASFEHEDQFRDVHKGSTKWDEMNILATHHPKDKDYGHMKIDEPKTPYSYDTTSGDEMDGINADLLAQKIKQGGNDLPKALHESPAESSEEDEDETPEERAKRKNFEMKRKHHYNEFAAVKLARKLMEDDDENGGGESIVEEEEKIDDLQQDFGNSSNQGSS